MDTWLPFPLPAGTSKISDVVKRSVTPVLLLIKSSLDKALDSLKSSDTEKSEHLIIIKSQSFSLAPAAGQDSLGPLKYHFFHRRICYSFKIPRAILTFVIHT